MSIQEEDSSPNHDTISELSFPAFKNSNKK